MKKTLASLAILTTLLFPMRFSLVVFSQEDHIPLSRRFEGIERQSRAAGFMMRHRETEGALYCEGDGSFSAHIRRPLFTRTDNVILPGLDAPPSLFDAYGRSEPLKVPLVPSSPAIPSALLRAPPVVL